MTGDRVPQLMCCPQSNSRVSATDVLEALVINGNSTNWSFHIFGSVHFLTFTFVSFQFNKHLFVHIGQSNPSYSDPYLESVDIRQIYDKFPEKKGGLKELFEKGPHNAFFLVKFWVNLHLCLCSVFK